MRKDIVSFVNILLICVIIFFVSTHFVHQANIIGWVLILLALLCTLSLKLFKVRFSSIYPDVVFGIIDNGILAVMAVFGGKIAGTFGAVIGGVVGNAITDGVAGLFEGFWAERYASGKRTTMGSAGGKMIGCLLGAGVVLIIVSLVNF